MRFGITSVVISAGASMIASASPAANTLWYSAGRSGSISGTDRPREAATHHSSPAMCATLDSGLRRPHLGGELGARLAASLRTRGWVRESDRPRELDLTPEGRAQLRRLGALR